MWDTATRRVADLDDRPAIGVSEETAKLAVKMLNSPRRATVVTINRAHVGLPLSMWHPLSSSTQLHILRRVCHDCEEHSADDEHRVADIDRNHIARYHLTALG